MTVPPPALVAVLADRYRIERSLGAGGMATVYLAHDLKHGRDVALKVLRTEVTAALGTTRFLAEIRTTARLQHAHILPLLDSGDAGNGILYYVMPVVTGETLRARLNRETQLAVADALRIADQVASALDYAHRQGVVHRDIKPENILLHEGQALVADFGIAIAADAASAGRLTETGMSLGTPRYMSPEQLAGERTVSGRSDIYALGAVVYEMLVGEPPFTGPTMQVITARVMTQKPTPIRALRDTVPVAVESAVLHALEKLPADRFASASEFARALHADAGSRITHRRVGMRTAAVVAAIAAVAAAAWAISRPRSSSAPIAPTTRATVPIASGFTLPTGDQLYPLNLSHDGRTLVYAAQRDGVRRLFVRRLSEFTESELANTEEATHPALSADGQWIAYFAHRQVMKIPVGGGVPIVVAPAPGRAGGISWTGDSLFFAAGGTLYLTIASRGTTSEIRIAPSDSSALRTGNLADRGLRWPQLLPGGRHVLLSAGDSVAVVELATGDLRTLTAGDQGSYLESGHLVFSAGEGRLRVARFDLQRLAVVGAAVPVMEVFRGPGSGGNYFAVSPLGMLAYVPGGFDRTLALVDRNGRETPVHAALRGYRFPRVSPDGRRAVVTIDPRPSKTWVVDLESGASAPVAAPGRSDDEHRLHPVWSPDGRQVAYGISRGIDVATVDGTPNVTPALSTMTSSAVPSQWLADGLVIGHTYGGPRNDIITFHVGDSAAVPMVATEAVEAQAAVSPDGRWLAYRSDISGARQVYVRPLRGRGEAIAISTSGGVEPRWARNGSELYYRNGQDIMAVSVRTRPVFSTIGKPQRLFSGGYDFLQDDNWDVTPDGRFLMVKADPNAGTQFLVVLNWSAELRARFGQ